MIALSKEQVLLLHEKIYERYGGAPLLGTRFPIIKAHGSSKASAIKSAVLQAKKCYESGVCEMIARDMEQKEKGEA